MKIILSIKADYNTETYEGYTELEVTRLPEKEVFNAYLEKMGKELLLKCDK